MRARPLSAESSRRKVTGASVVCASTESSVRDENGSWLDVPPQSYTSAWVGGWPGSSVAKRGSRDGAAGGFPHAAPSSAAARTKRQEFMGLLRVYIPDRRRHRLRHLASA